MHADQLESLIDKHGLSQVLTAIEDICNGKAEHIESNWQDSATARAWSKASKRVELANNIVKRLLD